ncbi:MAG TPA: DUF4397 domain-containing protein [Acidimicrobiales bacterium]
MSPKFRRPLAAVVALVAAVAALVTVSVTTAGAVDSSVTIVHGIPGVPVDVYAGGTDPGDRILTDFQPGTVAGPLAVPEGSLPVVVVPTGADPAVPANRVIEQTLAVPGGANLSVVANLTGGTPNLAAFANDLSAVPEGSSRITVRHTADAPAVDVLVNGEVAIPGLAPGAEASAVLPAGTYDIQVQLTDGTPIAALSPGSTVIPAGNAIVVYAVGSASDGAFPLGLVQQVFDVPVTPATTPTTQPATPAPAASVAGTPALTG